MGITRRMARYLAVPVLLLASAGWVRADESLLERVERHEDRVEAHRKDDASSELQSDLKKAVELFREAAEAPDGEKIQERLVKEVGSLSRVRDDTVRVAALETLGRMGHEDGARYVKRYLKDYKDAPRQRAAMAAVEAAGEVADDSLVRPLLRIVDKTKDMKLAARAVHALGGFGDSKRYRERIVEELIDTLKRDMPAAPKPGRDAGDTYLPAKNGHAGTSRWSVLSRAVPQSLNELTGRKLGSLSDWIAMVDEYERDLDLLFVDDDA